MSNSPIIDLLIVGGGPVGLTAAIEAQRMGLSCRIIEKKEKRRTNDSRAVVIHPRMLELLETHPGFIQSIDERAYTLPCLTFEFIDDHTKVSVPSEEQRYGDTEYPNLYFLPQYLTEKSLEEELDKGGKKVEYGTTFESLVQDAQCATVNISLANGATEVITAKYVLAADGGRSKVRESIGLTLRRTKSSVFFALSDMKIGASSPSKNLPGGHIMLTGEGPCAMLPLGSTGEVRLFMQIPDGLTSDNTTLDKAFFEQRIVAMTGKQFDVELSEWQSMFEVTHGVSNAYRKGRVFLSGDAAHVHSPIGGQGMNYGIWDAVTLVSKISWAERVLKEHPEATVAADAILGSYAEERHSMGEELISRVSFATNIVTTKNRPLQRIRNFAMRHILSFVKQDIMRNAGQLDLAYKPSYSHFILPVPGSWFWPKSFIAQPGHRVPNIVLEDGSKLYKQIDRKNHTWICINIQAPPTASDHHIYITPSKHKEQTSVPAISDETLARPQAILVRPDLFVAAVDDSVEALQAAVKHVYGVECFTAM